MILPVYTYGEEFLEKKMADVDLNDPDLPELIKNMYETMRISTIGFGLTAPQVGVNKQLLIVEGETDENFNGVFINPKIISYLGYEYRGDELCLSFPGLKLSVLRSSIIELEWYDEKKQFHRDFFMEFPARILQHEIDHLNGILMSERADKEDLIKNAEQLENIKKKKFKLNQPIFNKI